MVVFADRTSQRQHRIACLNIRFYQRILFGKPVPTFPGHALPGPNHAGCDRGKAVHHQRIMPGQNELGVFRAELTASIECTACSMSTVTGRVRRARFS